MAKKKRRDSTPKQRVEKACRNGRDVDFDYDETTDVLTAALDIVSKDAEVQHQKVKGIVGTLRKVSLPPPAKEATG